MNMPEQWLTRKIFNWGIECGLPGISEGKALFGMMLLFNFFKKPITAQFS